MQLRLVFIAASFVLLAACGDSETSQETGGTVTDEAAIPSSSATSAAPPAAAPQAFAQCRSCHSVEPGQNGVGPTLFGIVGSKAAEVPGYSFSPALAKSGITWDRASLDTWLQGPMKMVPGTKMVISQPDAAKRKEIVDYLETLK